MITFPFLNEKKSNLTRVSEYIYSPIESLDEIIPPSLKLYTNPYYEYPYIFEKSEYDIDYLKNYVHNHFDDKAEIGIEDLYSAGLVRAGHPIKVLSDGDVANSIKITAHKFSQKAIEKIRAAGGEAISLEG